GVRDVFLFAGDRVHAAGDPAASGFHFVSGASIGVAFGGALCAADRGGLGEFLDETVEQCDAGGTRTAAAVHGRGGGGIGSGIDAGGSGSASGAGGLAAAGARGDRRAADATGWVLPGDVFSIGIGGGGGGERAAGAVGDRV